MSIPFILRCSGCHVRIQIKEPSLVGKTVRCPKCKQRILVKAPDEPVAKPPAGRDAGPTIQRGKGAQPAPDTKRRSQQENQGGPSPRPSSRPAAATPKPAGRPRWHLPALIAGGTLGLALLVTILVLVLGGGDDQQQLAASKEPTTGDAAGSLDPEDKPKEASDQDSKDSDVTDSIPSSIPSLEVRPPEQGKEPAAAIAADADWAGLPPAARNVVVVRSQQPPRAANGVYFLQQQGRSFVACTALPGVAEPGNVKLTVDLFPGQPDQRTVPGRLVGVKRLLFLELIGTVPPPVEMTPQGGTAPPQGQARVFGFQPPAEDNPEVMNWAEISAPWAAGSRLEVPDEEMLGGALVCDEQGTPTAVLGSSLGRGQKQKSRAAISFQAISETTSPQGSGSLELREPCDQFVLGDGSQRPTYRVLARYTDLLQQVESMQLFIGSFNQLKSDITFDRQRYDAPVTADMRPVAVQRTEGNSHYGLLVLPDGVESKTLNVVTQMHFRLADGSEFYDQPRLQLAARPTDADVLTDELLARSNDQRQPDSAPVDFGQAYQPAPLSSERSIGLEETQFGDVRMCGYDLDSDASGIVTGGAILPHIVWSADGQHVFLLSKFGRVLKIRVADRTVVQTINLLAFCVDFDLSAAGLVVLGNGKLWVLDEANLQVKTQIDVPGASQVATAYGSRCAVVMYPRTLGYVDLGSGSVAQVPLRGVQDLEIPDTSFTAVAMVEDGSQLFVTDNVRLHRLGVTAEPALNWQESTPPLESVAQLILPAGGQRVVVRRSGLVLSRPGFPYGSIFVFARNDLQAPIVGLPGGGKVIDFALDPTSGGILKTIGSSDTQWLRGDGMPVAHLAEALRIEYGSFSPVETRLLAFADNLIREYTLPAELTAPDSLRSPDAAASKPKDMNRPLKSGTQQVDGWTVSTVDLPLNETVLPQSAHATATRRSVRFLAWTPSGDACLLVTADGILHRIRVPELIEERQVTLPKPVGLTLTSAGLVVNSGLRQELVVIDPQSLTVRDRVPVATPGDLTASPLQSRVWFIRPTPVRGYDPAVVTSVDLATGKSGREHTLADIRTMMGSLQELLQSQQSEYEIGSLRKLSQIAATPDGKYLFVSDGRNLVRFRIEEDTLVLQDATNDLLNTTTGPIVVSHDSKLVALQGGNHLTRKTHSRPQGSRGYGALVFPVDDFNRVAIPAITDAHGDALALNTQTGQAYSRTREVPLQVLGPDGSVVESIELPGGGEAQVVFSIDPQNRGVLMMGKGILWAEPGERSSP